VAEDWSHGADAGLTEAPQGPWLAAKARMREISRRSPPLTKRTKLPLPRPATTTHSRVPF
jgi:hypothetical protein